MSLYNSSFTSSGNISTGILVPSTSAPDITFATLSTCFISSSNFNMSFVSISSNKIIENAPILKSSDNIFSPCIVSMSFGK